MCLVRPPLIGFSAIVITPLVVFKQVNSLTGKFWLQGIQHGLCE